MNGLPSAIVLVFAAGFDYLIGDPRGWIHPVSVMGRAIDLFRKFALSALEKPPPRRIAGALAGAGLIIGSGTLSWLTFRWLTALSPAVSIPLQIVLLASCFAAKSLRDASIDVLVPLRDDDLDLARSRLSLYVGRDTENLSEGEILRAVLETVSENAVDGVTAPLFYALLGAFIGIGPVPLAIAYKASSTLDSMLGYLREPYRDIGWFSARTEDYLTWLPCRLTVLTLALLSGRPRSILALCRRDAPRDPSPNSGWSECVYAAILGVRLGGKNSYRGVITEKPFLGDDIYSITSEKIYQALDLTRRCFLLWLTLSIVFLVLLEAFSFQSSAFGFGFSAATG
ncbi:adenosylcobinamide-phosphate synthase CbiB [Pannus brasiliensis CCIBt3594]|uniref:Cobalamin biosynthesis protein CobD n=1 Tax=Pannus brasiliensis CCIBt3594 TaxID=1427578 RepID=A0AAW9QWS5_9CHRO